MAIGDDAISAGFPLVPDTGEDGRIRWGGRELNRTRDFIAQVLRLIPKTALAWQSKAGISSGTAAPSGGTDGDIYFQIL